jgi:RNA polymerase sigma-70 factor, ECF subfamily
VKVDDLDDLLQRGYRYAVALCGDPVQAEDLLQEAWANLLRADGPRTRPYLYRCIKNQLIDHLRRANVVAFDPLPDDLVAPLMTDLAVRETLFRALAVLRADEREALFLCAVEGHTTAEAADLMGKPRNTVLSLTHRGRARLRDWMRHNQEAMP